MKYYSIFSSVVFALLFATTVATHQEEDYVAEQQQQQPNHDRRRGRHLRATARNIPQASPTQQAADPASSSSLIMVSADVQWNNRDYPFCLNNCQSDRTDTCFEACGGKADCETECDLNPFFVECDSFCRSMATDEEEMIPLATKTTTMMIGVKEEGEDNFILNFCRFWFTNCDNGGPLPVLDETADDETDDDAFDRMFIQCKQLLPNCNPPSSLEEEDNQKKKVEHVQELVSKYGRGGVGEINPYSPPGVGTGSPMDRYVPQQQPPGGLNPYYGGYGGQQQQQGSGPYLPPGRVTPGEINPYSPPPGGYGGYGRQGSGPYLPPGEINPNSPPKVGHGSNGYNDRYSPEQYLPPGEIDPNSPPEVGPDYELPMGESAVKMK